jgi:WD40 repeat protein
MWTVSGWKPYAQFSDGFTGPAQCIAFTSDGATLAAGNEQYHLEGHGNPLVGSCIRYWDVTSRTERPKLELKERQDYGGFIMHVEYVPARGTLAISRTGAPSLMVSLATNKIVYRLGLIENSSRVTSSPDGKSLVGCNPPFPKIRLYRAEDGTVLASQSRGTPPDANEKPGKERRHGIPCDVRFSPDGKLIAAGCDDGTIYLFDGGLTREIARLAIPGGVKAIAFSQAGDQLAVASDKAVHLFASPSWEKRAVFDEHDDQINAIAWSPDARLLAVAYGRVKDSGLPAGKGLVRVRGVPEGRLVITLE